MSEGNHNSNEPPRRVEVFTPVSVGDFAEAAGLEVQVVIKDLLTMGFYTRTGFLVPDDVIRKVAKRHNLVVEFVRRPPRPPGETRFSQN